MSLRRGDLVYVAAKGSFTSRPRPAVVIQTDAAVGWRESVTVCLLTGDLSDAQTFRVRIMPSATNNLEKPSDVMADKVITVRPKDLDEVPIGRLSTGEMALVDRAVRFWLGL